MKFRIVLFSLVGSFICFHTAHAGGACYGQSHEPTAECSMIGDEISCSSTPGCSWGGWEAPRKDRENR